MTSSASHLQQIITQDFARNQVPSQPSTSTFQTSPSALSSTPVRTKTSSRYSPESQSQTVLHPRPGPRVSPENLVDKSRGRYSFVLYQTNFAATRQFKYVYKLGDSFLISNVICPYSLERGPRGTFLLSVLFRMSTVWVLSTVYVDKYIFKSSWVVFAQV